MANILFVMADDHGWMNLPARATTGETSHLKPKRLGNYACTTAYRRLGTPPLIGDSHDARVAELVDAHDSGSCPSNGVQVQPCRGHHLPYLVDSSTSDNLFNNNKYVS